MSRNRGATVLLLATCAWMLATLFGPTPARAGCINVYVDELIEVTPGQELRVPVYVSDVSQALWPIVSFDMSFQYCYGQDNLLSFVRIDRGPMLDATGGFWTLESSHVASNGSIQVAGAGDTALTGEGTLLYLVFNVSGSAQPCDVCDLDILTVSANDAAQSVDFCLNGGQVYVGSSSCTGYVTFWQNGSGVPGVKVRLFGTVNDGEPFQRTVWTDCDGRYDFKCLPMDLTDVDIMVSKNYDQIEDQGVSTQDASIVLRKTVGLSSADQYFDGSACNGAVTMGEWAADTSGDDVIGSYDASLILQFIVGSREHFPAGADCMFVPDDPAMQMDHGTCNGDGTGTNFCMVLRGDVNGSYANGAVQECLNPQGLAKVPTRGTTILSWNADEEGTVTVLNDGQSGFSNGVLEVSVPEGLVLDNARGEGLGAGLLAAGHQEGRVARIAFAGVDEVAGQGAVLTLHFRGDTSHVREVEIRDALLDEGAVVAMLAPSNEVAESSVPNRFTVFGNFPNPFNPKTTISFYLPEATPTSVKIFDQAGRLVRTLAADESMVGTVNLTWDGTTDSGSIVASGIYYYKVTAGSQTESGRMVLVK